MAVLRALRGLHPGQLFVLEGDSAVLGRHPDCDVVLESGAVSRQHARIINVDGSFYIEDLHSRNGTFHNGRSVQDRQLLSENDEVGICELVFVFHLGRPGPEGREERTDNTAAAMFVDEEQTTGNSTIMSKVDVSSGSSGLQLEVNAAAKLRALVEIGQHLGKALALSEVLPKLLDSLFTIFVQADRGFVVLKDPVSGRLVPEAVKHRRNDHLQTIRISRTVVNRVMEVREAILSADAASDARFDMAESIVDFRVRSMMCAPLINSEGKALGAIQIDALDQRSRFSREDLDVLASVACQAAFAVENAQLHETALREQALARELAVAHEVQQGFLPAAPPKIDRYDFFEFYEPANELGGDYYDYVRLRGGRLGVVVADVSGKGISASLLMAKLSAETRFCLASEPAPATAVERLNRVFCGSGWEDRFVTLVLCVLDPLRHEVTIVNAGHMAPLLRRGPQTVEPVAESETCLPLGVDDGVTYTPSTITLLPGECLTLFTDGITEAMNADDELYGHRRLVAQLAGDAERVGAIGRAILDDVKRFVNTRPQSDDMCLACFGRVDGGDANSG